MYLKVLFRLELLAANVARDVLRLHRVHVHDMLLQIRIVRVNFTALRTLGFPGLTRIILMMR